MISAMKAFLLSNVFAGQATWHIEKNKYLKIFSFFFLGKNSFVSIFLLRPESFDIILNIQHLI